MIIAILGVFAGLLLGYYFPVTMPAGSAPYILMLFCLAAYSGLLGVRGMTSGTFSARAFAARLFANAVLGLSLCWLGVRLDIPVYLAPVTAFTYMSFREIGLLADASPDFIRQNTDKKTKKT